MFQLLRARYGHSASCIVNSYYYYIPNMFSGEVCLTKGSIIDGFYLVKITHNNLTTTLRYPSILDIGLNLFKRLTYGTCS